MRQVLEGLQAAVPDFVPTPSVLVGEGTTNGRLCDEVMCGRSLCFVCCIVGFIFTLGFPTIVCARQFIVVPC